MAGDRITFLHEFDANGNPGDVTYSERRTIGQTLGQTTQKTGQKYALDTDGIQEFHGKGLSIEDSRYTPTLTVFDGTHQNGAFSAFEEAAKFVGGPQIIAIQNTISDYGELSTIKLIKGKEKLSFDNSISFEQLLSDMNTPGGRIASGVSQNLMKDNGFDNDHQLKDQPNAGIPVQAKYGVYQKTDTRFEVQLNEYKNLGIQLLFQASGEFRTLDDPSSDAQQAAFLLSSPLAKARMGVKIASNDLYPSKILKKQHPEFVKDPNSQYYGDPGYINGAPYNPLILFDGFSNGAQTAMCYVLFTALFATVTSVAATYQALHARSEATSDLTNRANYASIGRLFGQSPNQNGSSNFFGLIDTRYNYSDCVRAGMKAFFGFGADGSAANARLFINNPGYSSVVLRMIISDTLDIFGNSVLGSIIPGGIPSNTSAPSGVLEGLGQSSHTLDRLRSSKLLKFMNVVANIGDIILYLNESGFTSDLYAEEQGNVVILPTTQIIAQTTPGKDVLNLRNIVSNNRTKTQYGRGISWATATTPNAVNYTTAFHRARQYFVSSVQGETNAAFLNTIQKNTPEMYGSIKLSQDYVKKVEQQLGYAYLPFYFQDLRTNEIISFHGFLSDLNDSHSTDYETSEAYGRAGTVHHYKNIKRKTSLRFWMVATNKDDFDLMWYKLNRLIAMSQPMYTKGRQVSYTAEDGTLYKFTQPFSQIPGATPICRIRVGDLITTNRSELDVARLFGLGDDSAFGISQNTFPPDQTTTDAANESTMAPTSQGSISAVDEILVGKDVVLSQTLYAEAPRVTGTNGTITNVAPTRQQRRVKTLNAGEVLSVIKLNNIVNGSRTIVVRASSGTITYEITDTLIHSSCSETADTIIQKQIAQDSRMATTIQAQQQQVSQENANQQNPTTANDVTSWLRNTPIFKSFETAAGEGMMAVIESIDPQFDISSMTWEDEPGSVAPKAFEVSVAFSPMYDINPGLAADGQMIGALYRAGRINHGMKAIEYPSDKYRLSVPSGEGTATPSGQPPSTNPSSGNS